MFRVALVVEQERLRLWMAVSKAESEVARLTRAGKTEEAEAMRAHVDALKHEDPYTSLQEQLDEAVAKEASFFFLACA